MNNDTEIQAIVDQHPSLHLWGHGKSRHHKYDVDEAREELTHPATMRSINHAASWARRTLKPSPARHSDRSAYYWKHAYERETGRYLPCGAFAAAAILAGLPVSFEHFNGTIHARERR